MTPVEVPAAWTVVDMTVLRIIRHNEVKQTCTETSSHPSLAACAQDVTTVQQLKKTNMLPMVT